MLRTAYSAPFAIFNTPLLSVPAFQLKISAALCACVHPLKRGHATNHKRSQPDVPQLFKRLVAGDRAALARAITVVESTHPAHIPLAQELLDMVLNYMQTRPTPKLILREEACSKSDGEDKDMNEISVRKRPQRDLPVANLKTANLPRLPLPSTFRIGLSGAPGVGKSSFIESFGSMLTAQGLRVAVLAVDPSSSRSGGSILGDKTRMERLSKDQNAYVRPSPAGLTLGGVARSTSEALLICEAAGYDFIIVETVGVGQTETMVADMVDMFVLLVAPGGGDELQGLKKGIVELSDLIVVNKADGVLETPARLAQIEYTSALKFVTANTPNWRPQVVRVSSHTNFGIGNVWDIMLYFYKCTYSSGVLQRRRREQQLTWMWRQITGSILYKLKTSARVKDRVKALEQDVKLGKTTFGRAAEIIVRDFLHDR